MIFLKVLFAKLNYNHTLWHPRIQTISQSDVSDNGTILDQYIQQTVNKIKNENIKNHAINRK
jgi:hypothetical protein